MTQRLSKQPEELFHYCFYHVLSRKHTNYHHVLIKTEDQEVIKRLDADEYTYCLMSVQPVFLDEADQKQIIIRGLIMDGESLLKRFKAQQNKSIQTKNQE